MGGRLLGEEVIQPLLLTLDRHGSPLPVLQRVTEAPLRCYRSVARLGQPGRVDVQVLGRAIGAGHVQDLAQSDDLERLVDQNDLGILPTRAIHADHVISDGLENEQWQYSADVHFRG